MIGNISKKKGDNGDFYTKAAVDRKITDAENKLKKYASETVGEKFEAVDEKLEEASEKLETKVDKVEGKGLVSTADIRTAMENNKIKFKDGIAFAAPAAVDPSGYSFKIDGDGLYLGYGGGSTTVENGDVIIDRGGEVHKLSEKIGVGTTLIRSTDKIRLESTDNVGPSGIEINPHFSNDIGKAFIKVGVSPTSPSKTVVGTGSITGSDMEKSFSISGNDIICSPNSKVTHKLSEKVDKVSGKSLIDENVADRLSYDSTTTNIVVSSISQGIEARNFIGMEGNASISANGLISGQHLTIETDGADNIPGVVGIEAKNGDVTANVCIDPNSGAYKLHKLSEKANSADIGTLSDLATTDKSSIVAAINEVKSSGGGDVLDNLTYDSTNDIINSSANLLLENSASVAAYNGTFRGDIKIGQLGANKWAYTISPITGFSTSVDVTCTSGNVVHNLAAKADTTNVLTRNNTQTFTPTGDYQPATKKYVDDAIAALKLDLGLE